MYSTMVFEVKQLELLGRTMGDLKNKRGYHNGKIWW